ncbi:MAG: hypothetical protein SD837_18990 [Candidatus Electrothrix scaldis]|nr:MAG: hypothetical protein SD837_18990 [Candidatus Electrothrix sp. GW3-3]
MIFVPVELKKHHVPTKVFDNGDCMQYIRRSLLVTAGAHHGATRSNTQ